jgi:hypothetical protein
MKLQVALVVFTLGTALFGQEPASHFVLNPSKPYVYIQFDHVGPRTPISKGEGNVGLWLRIVNNCREPILVPTFGLPSGDPDPGAVVLDEIVPDAVTTYVVPGGVPLAGGSAKPEKSPPEGYSAEVFSMTRVLPGKNLLFSVPLDHVMGDWFMRVRVALDVNKPGVGRGPYTYLEFLATQIPPGALPNGFAGKANK